MKRALVVIDVQNEYFSGKLPVSYPKGSLDNIVKAMDTAVEKSIPVVVIQHHSRIANGPTFQKNSPAWELHPRVAKHTRDVLFEKDLPGSFTGTPLEAWLRERKIDTITICGYMTQTCCDTTARQAFHLDFNVEFLSDATGTLAFKNAAGEVTAEELHRAILVTQQTRFSQVLTTTAWLEKL